MVRVLGKGGKERIVPFNGSTAPAIRAYLNDRETLVIAVPRPIVERGRPAGRHSRGSRTAADDGAIRCS